MIDTTTSKPITVETDGGEWPYIILPAVKLDEVRALLDTNGIRYWVDAEFLSLDDGPEVAFVNLQRQTDPVRVQQLLDGIP